MGNGKITEYIQPYDKEGNHDVYVDEDGSVWSTGQYRGVLYKLNPDTAEFEEISVPVKSKGPLLVRNIVPAKEPGQWWILMGSGTGKVMSYNPRTNQFGRLFTFTPEGRFYPHTMNVDKEGNIWVADYLAPNPRRVAYLNTQTGEVKIINLPQIPGPYLQRVSWGYGLRIAPNGDVWLTLLALNRLVQIEPKTMEVTVRELPTLDSGPRRIDVDAEGNVWIPEYTTGKLAKFDPRTAKFQEYPLPAPDAGPYTVRVHPKTGEVWIVTTFCNKIFHFDPKT